MAGILDFLNGQTGGGSQGGLLDFLRANALNQQAPGGLPSDAANYGQAPQGAPSASPFSIAGPNQPSPLDTAQWPAGPVGAPSNANAAMPAPAPMSFAPQPQPQAPTPAAPAAPSGPGLGDRLSAGFGSIQHSSGLIPSLINGISGFSSGQRADPQSVAQSANEKFLFAKGIDPASIAAARSDPELMKKLVTQNITQQPVIAALQARGATGADISAAVANPEYMKKILDNSVKEQDQFRPATPQERQAAGMAGDNNTPMFINKSTNEPKFGPPQTNVNVSTEKTGQAELATLGVKAYTDAQAASRESQKRLGMYDAFEKAAQGFTPGATAEMRLTAKRYLKDAGLIKGEDVPDGEIQQMIGRQLAIHAQPKGQGAVSNYERQLYASALPSMIQSPEGLKQAIAINRKLEQFDQQVAQIYRDSARANKGLPNYLDVQDKIAALGSPLGDGDMAAIQPSSGASPAGPVAPAATAPAKALAPGNYVWTPGKGLSK